MEQFVFILILLACAIASSIVDQFVHRVSLPLIQIAIGFMVACFWPEAASIEVDPELFLVLFIAPLLFNEAREARKADLWNNKGSILSMAIGLVLITVLVVGFSLHALVPSIPLAAAFACAGALGPTDAAAVGALGSTIKLSPRQKILLSGESLINDASGVVSFEFAIAAALTGAFSAVEAGQEFLALFFGGIAAGLVMGFLASFCMRELSRLGYENVVVTVLYEVMTPFVVFLLAEAINVSGILAVVAAGLVMARTASPLMSSEQARYHMVSDAFWDILVFLINAVVFLLLGMQLIKAMSPTLQASMHPLSLIGITCIVTILVVAVRFVWVSVLELFRKDPETGQRGTAHAKQTLKDALVTTIAGPKGAVTLSIIFTIPLTMNDGSPFPERDLIIFITAGTILLTLILADAALPKLAPLDAGKSIVGEEEVRNASSMVIRATIAELETRIASGAYPEYEPATHAAIARLRARLARLRFDSEVCGDSMRELVDGVMQAQQARADEIQREGLDNLSPEEAAPYLDALRAVRSSVGYFGNAKKVGARSHSWRGRLAFWRMRLRRNSMSKEKRQRVYYETCLFELELDKAAIAYLQNMAEHDEDEMRRHVAAALVDQHQAVIQSITQRLGWTEDTLPDDKAEIVNKAVGRFDDQLDKARRYADEVDASAYVVELEQIGKLEAAGQIDKQVAAQLREDVYLMQMSQV